MWKPTTHVEGRDIFPNPPVRKKPLARSKKPKRKKRRLSSSSSDVNPTEARLSRMEGMIENLFHLVSGNKERRLRQMYLGRHQPLEMSLRRSWGVLY
nr:unnamed protein product [Callosobruchus chinensis]